MSKSINQEKCCEKCENPFGCYIKCPCHQEKCCGRCITKSCFCKHIGCHTLEEKGQLTATTTGYNHEKCTPDNHCDACVFTVNPYQDTPTPEPKPKECEHLNWDKLHANMWRCRTCSVHCEQPLTRERMAEMGVFTSTPLEPTKSWETDFEKEFHNYTAEPEHDVWVEASSSKLKSFIKKVEAEAFAKGAESTVYRGMEADLDKIRRQTLEKVRQEVEKIKEVYTKDGENHLKGEEKDHADSEWNEALDDVLKIMEK